MVTNRTSSVSSFKGVCGVKFYDAWLQTDDGVPPEEPGWAALALTGAPQFGNEAGFF
jgi:hypothetical protein